ncbi:hypothetical protein [Aestuariibacter salexigens]|uniref:hypothetical protein n=1 Tax=Aestuariibacter salexigens TaxID=226010 RepID=UPI0004018452|nr:hypothetical protein [Aestuariibacter salexigens]
MLSITSEQMEALSQNSDKVFLYKVKSILDEEFEELLDPMSESELYTRLEGLLKESRRLNITIEQDVFDFMVLNLEHGEGFYKSINFDLEWLGSQYVPGQSKIQGLRDAIEADSDNAEEA